MNTCTPSIMTTSAKHHISSLIGSASGFMFAALLKEQVESCPSRDLASQPQYQILSYSYTHRHDMTRAEWHSHTRETLHPHTIPHIYSGSYRGRSCGRKDLSIGTTHTHWLVRTIQHIPLPRYLRSTHGSPPTTEAASSVEPPWSPHWWTSAFLRISRFSLSSPSPSCVSRFHRFSLYLSPNQPHSWNVPC